MESRVPTVAEKNRPKLRWYQYSLRSLLLAGIAVALLCSLLKWLGASFFLGLFQYAVEEYTLVTHPAFMLACGTAVRFSFVKRPITSFRHPHFSNREFAIDWDIDFVCCPR
jgi:hypothetical protein